MHLGTMWKVYAGALLLGAFLFAMLVAALFGWVLIRFDIGGPDRVEVRE